MIIFKKKNKIPILLSIIFILPIVFFIFTSLINNHHYDQQGTNLINFRQISKINTFDTPTILLEQSFYSQNENLSYINFYVYNNSKQTKITLSLIEERSKVLLTEEIMIPSAEYLQYINWDFKDIKNSLNKKYSLLIELSPSINLDIITVSSDLYENGILSINGQPKNNILAFSFGYSTDNILLIIKNRISTYKPFIFKYYISFIVLIVLILSLAIYIIYLLTKLLVYN